MDVDSYTNDEVLNSILSEINENDKKRQSLTVKHEEELPELSKDNLEDFIIENNAKSINTTQRVINSLLEQAESTGDPEIITSIAEMISANNRSLETLTKIHLNNEKIKQAKELELYKQQVKVMADNAQKTFNQPMTREEVMNLITSKED